MSKGKPLIRIQNVVASVSLNQKIDLNKIVSKFPQTEYNPSVFPGLVFRIKKPKTATLIFSTMIQNIVASAELGGQIDLESLVYKLGRVMYEPEQFPGAVYRMDEPKVVFLVFSAGKLVCVGAKKEEQIYEAVNKIEKLLEEKDLIFYPENEAAHAAKSLIAGLRVIDHIEH